MVKVKLRDFANMPAEKVLNWRGNRFWVEVEDDFKETKKVDSSALMLTWEGMIVHRAYNDVPYSIKEVIPTGGIYNDDTLAIPVNYALGKAMPNIHCPVETDAIKRLIYTWQGRLNNLLTVMTEPYVISATAEDVVEAYDNEEVADIRRRIKAGKLGIDDGEELFTHVMLKSEALNFNTLALLVRTGGVSVNQAYQTLVVRGSVFDLNDGILPNPILDCYAEGITNLVDSMGDSKAAGVSLNTNGRVLKDSEWWHRKSHLYTAVLSGIAHLTDCGSTVGVPLVVTGRDMANSLLGKWRIMEDDSLELINYDTVKKIKAGDTVTVRSIAFCDHDTPGDSCGVCYGMMKGAVPYNVMTKRSANIGMYSSTTICNPIGQKMLSTKHFIRNATTREFVVAQRDKDIFTTNGDEIFLKKDLCVKGTDMVLRATITKDLTDLKSLDGLDEVVLHNLPHFSEVTIRYEEEDVMVGGVTTVQHSASTRIASRYGRFSMGFLEYILETGWEVIDRRYIKVDLSKWTYKEPMFSLPFVRESLEQHRVEVESFLTFSKRNAAWKRQFVTPTIYGETLSEFWALINKETKGTNIIHTEVMLTATLASDPEAHDYSLPLASDAVKKFTSFIDCITKRGSGTLMIFERQQQQLDSINQFLIVNKPPSELEGFFRSMAR